VCRKRYRGVGILRIQRFPGILVPGDLFTTVRGKILSLDHHLFLGDLVNEEWRDRTRERLRQVSSDSMATALSEILAELEARVRKIETEQTGR